MWRTVEFRKRVLSALVLTPTALAAVWAGGIYYWFLAFILFTGALNEWLRLVLTNGLDRKQGKWAVGASLCLQTAMLAILIVAGRILGDQFVVWNNFLLIEAGLIALAAFLASRISWRTALWSAAGIPYIGGSCLAILYLRGLPDIGLALTLYLCVVVWGTDIGAYLAGRLIGGPKLAPAISPSKTWSGLFGGMALAALGGYGVAVMADAHSPLCATLLAPALAVVAQAGDFFESYVKRRAGVKDSGKLIPGHGGILDRIDGLVFAAPGLAAFHVTAGAELSWW